MGTVIICGTPGTGKSTLIEKLMFKLSSQNIAPKTTGFINLSKFAIDNECTSGFDERLGSYIIDDDKLAERLEPLLAEPGRLNILESIHADHLEPDKVDRVFVVRTSDTARLYDRLKDRDYNQEKISNNVEAEIFQLIYDEASELFGAESVIQLQNNHWPDLDKNVDLICQEICDLLNLAPN